MPSNRVSRTIFDEGQGDYHIGIAIDKPCRAMIRIETGRSHFMRILAALGRSLQLVGLFVPLYSLFMFPEPVKLFAALGFSVAAFLLGRIIEGYARR